jgi:DNA-binding MarR family transcriptional regulator
MMGGLLIASIASGQAITKTGIYKPFPIAGTALTAVGMYLLSLMDRDTSVATASAYMFVLGVGLGLTMQVLVLAVQNAVDYRDLGVATSGATLFRSIGGSIGTAVLGTVFANRLIDELTARLPSDGGAGATPGNETAVNPQNLDRLAAPIHSAYIDAYTSALGTVFLVGAAIAVVAFGLSWLIEQRHLRSTVTTDGVGKAFAMPSETDSISQILRGITAIASTDARRRAIELAAQRAGVDLTPAACALLARYDRDPETDPGEVARAWSVRRERVDTATAELESHGLVTTADPASGPGPPEHELTIAGREILARLVAARRERLSERLADWSPEQHAELAAVVQQVARELTEEPDRTRAPATLV